MSKIELRRVEGNTDEYSTAVNTEVLLDGKVLHGVQSVKIDMNLKNVAPIVEIKLVPEDIGVGDLNIELNTLTNKKEFENEDAD